MSVVDQVKLLYESQLYADVKTLCGMLLTLNDHNPEFLMLPIKYQVLVYQAEALFNLGEYKKAENAYISALHVKKMINKTKGKGQSLGLEEQVRELIYTRELIFTSAEPQELPSEVEVKFRLHQCYCHLKQYKDAVVMLEGIINKQRTPKINLALARLYHRTGMDRSAITTYKEVLRECPMSLEGAQGLLCLGVKGAEVASLMMNGISNLPNIEWVLSWVKGQAFAAGRDYNNAIQTFKNLDVKPVLRDNVDLLCSLGESQFLTGEYTNAMLTLQRVRFLDPLLLKNMDLLAFLYYRDKKMEELDSLANQLMGVSELAPEPWVAMGYFCMGTKKGTRAVYFANKAHTLDSRSLEALLLKGTALLELKKNQDAIQHFREALRLAPHRYEAHKSLIDCYLAAHRTREAIVTVGQAYKQLGSNARSYTLYASVLAKDPLTLEKAKSYLEKAMKLDSSYLEAVYLLAETLQQQQQFDKAIELLRKALTQQNTCRLHQMLGDLFIHTNEHFEALDQFGIALSLDPNNAKALEGMERVEKHSDMGMDNSYDVEVEDMDNSDQEADLEGSDIESAWSDIDLS